MNEIFCMYNQATYLLIIFLLKFILCPSYSLLHFKICMHVCMLKYLQSCQSLCDSMDCSLLGSSVLGGSPGKNNGVG